MTSRLAPRTRLGAVAAALALFASAGTSRADTITFTGGTTATAANDQVSFSGTMDVKATSTTTSVLTVTLKNTTGPTSDAAKYGFITGFGFNVPTGITAGTPTTTDADFKLLNGSSATTYLQGGAFDYAFSIGNELHTVDRNLSSAASVALISKGLGAGQSATFSVVLTGTGAGSLTAANLIKELSASPSVPFSVRFRSTNAGTYAGEYQGTAPPDGDKVPVDLKTVKPVPAPPAVVLASIGFGGLMVSRLRRRK